VVLPAFACRTPLLQHTPTDISRPSMHPQQQTCCCRFAAVGPCWDSQTDGLTPYHFIDSTMHSMWEVSTINENNVQWLSTILTPTMTFRPYEQYMLTGCHGLYLCQLCLCSKSQTASAINTRQTNRQTKSQVQLNVISTQADIWPE